MEDKPPLGLRPEWVVNYHNALNRVNEIEEAMTRYAMADKRVPIEWCHELRRRIQEFIAAQAVHRD